MTYTNLESLTKAVCIIEKIRGIEDGNSYRRGRSAVTGRYVSRDSAMSIYNDGNSARSYGNGNISHNYSGHSIQDRMIDQLEKMFDEAQIEHERQTVRKWINRLRK